MCFSTLVIDGYIQYFTGINLSGFKISGVRVSSFFGDELILVRKNQINYKIQVIGIPESRVGAKLVDLYRIDLTPKEEFGKTALLKYSKDYYRKKGTGRPTKKDRRDIDDYNEISSI